MWIYVQVKHLVMPHMKYFHHKSNCSTTIVIWNKHLAGIKANWQKKEKTNSQLRHPCKGWKSTKRRHVYLVYRMLYYSTVKEIENGSRIPNWKSTVDLEVVCLTDDKNHNLGHFLTLHEEGCRSATSFSLVSMIKNNTHVTLWQS